MPPMERSMSRWRSALTGHSNETLVSAYATPTGSLKVVEWA